jgi:hypothetical protein
METTHTETKEQTPEQTEQEQAHELREAVAEAAINTADDSVVDLSTFQQSVNLLVDELNIKDNAAAVEKLADYLLNPEKIKDLINEEDIYQLFITKFKKLI